MIDLLHSTGRVGDGMKCSPRQIHDLTVDPIEAKRPDLVFSELIFEKLDCRTIIPSRVCHVSLLLCTKWPAVESSARIGNNFGLLHSAQVSPSKKIFRETQSSSQASLSEFVWKKFSLDILLMFFISRGPGWRDGGGQSLSLLSPTYSDGQVQAGSALRAAARSGAE